MLKLITAEHMSIARSMVKESKIESYKNQRNTYVGDQSFPEAMSEEKHIHCDYSNYHHQEKNNRCDIFIHAPNYILTP